MARAPYLDPARKWLLDQIQTNPSVIDVMSETELDQALALLGINVSPTPTQLTDELSMSDDQHADQAQAVVEDPPTADWQSAVFQLLDQLQECDINNMSEAELDEALATLMIDVAPISRTSSEYVPTTIITSEAAPTDNALILHPASHLNWQVDRKAKWEVSEPRRLDAIRKWPIAQEKNQDLALRSSGAQDLSQFELRSICPVFGPSGAGKSRSLAQMLGHSSWLTPEFKRPYSHSQSSSLVVQDAEDLSERIALCVLIIWVDDEDCDLELPQGSYVMYRPGKSTTSHSTEIFGCVWHSDINGVSYAEYSVCGWDTPIRSRTLSIEGVRDGECATRDNSLFFSLTTDGFEGLIKRGYLRTIKRRTVATLACVTDFVSFTCVYAGPVVKTAHVLSVGEPELAKQMTTLTKVWLDDSLSAFGATGTAKSVEEAIDYRVRFAAAALEKAMAQSNKIAETLISKCHWGDRTLLKSE